MFNPVLQFAEKDLESWRQKKCLGTKLGDDKEKCCISNLRFADDVLLLAS